MQFAGKSRVGISEKVKAFPGELQALAAHFRGVGFSAVAVRNRVTSGGHLRRASLCLRRPAGQKNPAPA
jgi:hypothetical protein